MNTESEQATHSALLLSWLQLLRVSALPTAISNILAGFLVASGDWLPVTNLLLLIASSCCLYMSGMVLNDWWDRDVDQLNRSNRPIPSGRVSSKAAFTGYLMLTLTGILLAAAVSMPSLGCAISLVVAIALYDCVLKRTAIAPMIMGLCRGLNILLGASAAPALQSNLLPGFTGSTIWIAVCLGIFITGVTWFARKESEGDNRRLLVSGSVIMVFGVAGFILTPLVFDVAASQSALLRYIAIVSLVALPIAVRAFAAIKSPMPANIGVTVGTALRSLILFDAAIAYLFSQCQVAYPIAILLLLIPALLMSRWISPT